MGLLSITSLLLGTFISAQASMVKFEDDMMRILPIFLAVVLLAACVPPSRGKSDASPNIQIPNPQGDANPLGDATSIPPGNLMPTSPGDQTNYAPQPGDGILSRGNIYLDSAQVLILESYPVQIVVVLTGNLPDPCHHLRVAVDPPDNQNRIMIEVYSVYNQNSMCIQVLEPFSARISLGSFPVGHYTVWVNGRNTGEFDS